MTIEDIASFCEFLNCRVSVGHPDYGFIHIDGTGIESHSYTYGRVNMFNEAASQASPRDVLENADTFVVARRNESQTLNRTQFVRELEEFQRKTGIV